MRLQVNTAKNIEPFASNMLGMLKLSQGKDWHPILHIDRRDAASAGPELAYPLVSYFAGLLCLAEVIREASRNIYAKPHCKASLPYNGSSCQY